jgi:hypothetical protein
MLRIQSKRLSSGRFQVNFNTNDKNSSQYYGYMLAEPSTSLTDIIIEINQHIQAFRNSERYFQRNLFSLGNRKQNKGRILIFKSKDDKVK